MYSQCSSGNTYCKERFKRCVFDKPHALLHLNCWFRNLLFCILSKFMDGSKGIWYTLFCRESSDMRSPGVYVRIPISLLRDSLRRASGNLWVLSKCYHTIDLPIVLLTHTDIFIVDWLMVQQGWTQNKLKRKGIRYGFTLPPVILGLAAAIPPIFFTMYNPGEFERT